MNQNKYAIASAIDGNDIKKLRKQLRLTQKEFAMLANVSEKTVAAWEIKNEKIKGTISSLVKILSENPQIVKDLEIPNLEVPLRLWYMFKNEVCSVIDIDERHKEVKVYNYVKDDIFKAFGVIEKPSYNQYIEFIESRCFPRERADMKLILSDLNLPFYNPLLIIEKTEGRMAEDDFWIKIERLK